MGTQACAACFSLQLTLHASAGQSARKPRSVGAMSDMSLPVRIGDDAAVLDLVPLASDMPTVEDLRMVLGA